MPPQTLLFVVILSGTPVPEGVVLPEYTRDGVTARLTVHVEGVGVHLTLDVTGGPLLEVEPATCADPAHDWEARRNEWCRLSNSRLTWTQSLLLKQIKPGAAALPDVMVRFRDGPAAAWQKVEWVDILTTARDAPPPEFMPTPPPVNPWMPWVGLAAVAAALTALAWACRRRLPRKWLPPDRRALCELRRLEESFLTDLSSADYHSAVSEVVRGYLAERFNLPATRQTTAEFLRTAAGTGRLSEEQQALLRDFLGRCDLAKFAPIGASASECRETAAQARALVGETAGARTTQTSA